MIDNLLMVAFGVFGVLVGYGKINISKDPVANAQHLKKYGTLFRIAGIVLIVCGLGMFLFR
jgi:pyridoxal biosynthesis lyase PdxS